MASPDPFAFSFNRGMRQDEPREQMQRGSAWNLIDWIPQYGGPLVKRGGYTYYSADISVTRATASYVAAVAHAPFSAGAKLVAIDEDGRLYTIATNGTVTDVDAAVVPLQSPVFHRNKLIVTASDGTTAPKVYDGSTVAVLGGSPPAAKYAAVYKDRTLLGNTNAQPQRLSFSDPGDPATWNAAGYIDTSAPIRGIAALRSAVLVFHDDRTERLRGATPPPNTDMVLENIFDQGCVDARSIALYGEYVIFANQTGVFLTDAATIVDLTEQSGLSRYWQTALASYTTSYTLSAGVYRGHYIVSVMNGSTFVDCLVFDIDRRLGFRFSNMKALTFSPAVGTAGELFFGVRSAPRVGSFSSVFAPAASVKNDGDGTAVAPIMETQFTPVQGLKRVRHVYVAYDIRDAATDNPTLTVSYLTSPESSSYTALTPTLAETTAIARPRIDLGKVALGFGFKVHQSNASSATYLYGIELGGHELEKSRRG